MDMQWCFDFYWCVSAVWWVWNKPPSPCEDLELCSPSLGPRCWKLAGPLRCARELNSMQNLWMMQGNFLFCYQLKYLSAQIFIHGATKVQGLKVVIQAPFWGLCNMIHHNLSLHPKKLWTTWSYHPTSNVPNMCLHATKAVKWVHQQLCKATLLVKVIPNFICHVYDVRNCQLWELLPFTSLSST